MRSYTAGFLTLISFLLLVVPPAAALSEKSPSASAKQEVNSPKVEEEVLSNKDIVALTKAKLGDDILLEKIKQSPKEAFDVSTDGLIALKKDGVSQGTIAAIMKRVQLRNHPDAAAPETPTADVSADDNGKAEKPSRWKVWKRGTEAKSPDEHTKSNDDASKKPDEIRLFFTDKPASPYKELGRVSAGKYNLVGITRDRAAIDQELRKKASELGANAVINITEDFASVSGVAVALDKKN